MLRNAKYIMDNIIIADEINTTKQYCKAAQVGVDVTVNKVYKITEPGIIKDSKSYVSKYEEIKPEESNDLLVLNGDEGFFGWFLEKGTYLIELNEGFQFGPKDTGYFIQRSSFNRSGCTVISSIWDPGFNTRQGDKINSSTLRLNVDTEKGIYLEKNVRVAQLIVFENEETELYDGQYQGGRITSRLVK